jgi:hypothetical protein
MRYHDISQVSILGLHGLLHVQEAGNAEAVSVQIDGPYEVKVADGSCLLIYPEGQEPPISRRPRSDIAAVSGNLRRYLTDTTIGWTHVGLVDATVNIQLLAGSGLPVKTRVPARSQAIARITAPPGTKFQLMSCYGLRKGLRGWHIMEGDSRFDT